MKDIWATYNTLTLRLLVIVVLAPLTLSARPLARAVAGEGKGEGARIPATPNEPAPLSKISAAVAAYGKLPLSFEANQGQTDRRVKFLSRGAGYGLFLTATEAVLSLNAGTSLPAKKASVLPISLTQKPSLQKSAVLRMRLECANRNARVSGLEELPGKSNYFVGKDRAKWRSNIPTFGRVKYQQVYSGVDLIYYGNQRRLEYDFLVQPGADPRQIELSFDGAQRLRLDADGNLIVSIAGGEVIEHKPVIYQEFGGRRLPTAGGYELRNNGQTVGFKLAAYDSQRNLTIDPALAYSTYLGGSDTSGGGIALDSSGNAYVTGHTNSSNFPITAGAFQTTFGGNGNAFVSKLNRSGSALLYSTYLGGSGDIYADGDYGYGIAVDSAGNAYVTGSTGSSDFPITAGAFHTTFGGSLEDAFVSKLNRSGSALLYSTYLGGSSNDVGYRIAVDSTGNAYITGQTGTDFPITAGAFQTTYSGGDGDAFVSKLNGSGSALVYSTYLGGSGYYGDFGNGIAVDSAGNAYVTGVTSSSDFPTTAGAFQTASLGGEDAFVSKLNRSGSALVYSTYLGGSDLDGGGGIAADAAGNVYVTGHTYSGDFPTTAGAFQTSHRGAWYVSNVFVSKLNSSGSALVYSTYLGGSRSDSGYGIALDSEGNAYITGYTVDFDFPTTAGAFQTTYGGGYDAFVSKLNSNGSALAYSTYLGGRIDDYGYGIALDSEGNAYVTGNTSSGNFPTTTGALQSTNGGDYNEDAFVSKFSLGTIIPLSRFIGGLLIDPDAGAFYLRGGFRLAPGGSINPLAEPMTLGVGKDSVTLAAGSFVKNKTGYFYHGTVKQILVYVYIKFTSTPGTYALLVDRKGGPLTSTTNRVPVTLTIGNDSGTVLMHAKVFKLRQS